MSAVHKHSRKSTASKRRTGRSRGKSRGLTEFAQMAVWWNDKRELWNVALLTLIESQKRSRRNPLPEYAKVVGFGEADEVAGVRGHVGIVLEAAADEAGRTYTVYFPTKQESARGS